MARGEAEVGATLDLRLQALARPEGAQGHSLGLVFAGGHQGLAVDDWAAADGGCSLQHPRAHLCSFSLLGLGRQQRGWGWRWLHGSLKEKDIVM